MNTNKKINISDKTLGILKKAFSEIDFFFALKLVELNGDREKNFVLFITALLLSYSVSREQDTCLKLTDTDHLKLKIKEILSAVKEVDDEVFSELDECFADLSEKLLNFEVVGKTGDFKPVILDNDRLYLQKYWFHEQKIAKRIINFADVDNQNTDINLLSNGLNRIFPISSIRKGSKDWQRVAAFSSVVNNFNIITGGPGTGKTTVVTAVLLLLQEQSIKSSGKPLEIRLCAPTGKAAARMVEAVSEEKGRIDYNEELKSLVPAESSTIHRLLGPRYLSPNFKYCSKRKLDIDVLVIDEASMVPMILMSKLLDAVSDRTKIILLGDKNQLASVEAGAVFADICDYAASSKGSTQNTFTQKFSDKYNATNTEDELELSSNSNKLTDSVVELIDSYRFDPDQGIGRLKDRVNKGNIDLAFDIISKGNTKEVSLKNIPANERALEYSLNCYLKDLNENDYNVAFLSYFKKNDLLEAFEAFNSFRVLCAHRIGLWGSEKINYIITKLVKMRYGISSKTIYFKGLPIVIKSNYRALNLFNGDIGLCWPKADNADDIAVFFPDNKNPGQFRSLIPTQLPEHETVFAMTVHKSQGSGFENVLLILSGNTDSSVLARELVYTGITRAKKKVDIWSSEDVFKKAIYKKTVRNSGIIEKLRNS
ncbi:MAG: exodeoxyribonuclease V subunit alpha [Victivallales bacterium]|nr:exodeoxyribonuclease V subunit alpha [Victivallales bacterium]MCF7889436.1 exodeoxyribonuclease V subunit alpha [Victivallales bacterium]